MRSQIVEGGEDLTRLERPSRGRELEIELLDSGRPETAD